MSKSKRNPDTRYPTDVLLRSKPLSGYQQDFAAALLTKPAYALDEALEVLNEFFKGGGR